MKQVLSCEADGYLVRNHDHLQWFADKRRRGDFSLNVANPLTAEYFAGLGLDRVTVSYDLNVEQVLDLLAAAPPKWFELTLHQHMPMFHMEHCVFCAFLSSGKDYRDCGRPCDTHRVALRDRVGAELPLRADAGCRNTVFNSVAQSSARLVPRLLQRGVRRFRVEFVRETESEAATILAVYRDLVAGRIGPDAVLRALAVTAQHGVSSSPMQLLVSQPGAST